VYRVTDWCTSKQQREQYSSSSKTYNKRNKQFLLGNTFFS